jgi:protein-L-isoaspartate O-methyltransferase
MDLDCSQSAFFKTRRNVLRLFAACVAGSLGNSRAIAQNAPARKLDVPYEPSPPHIVDRMLELANVSKNDVLYDLGSGDGRIVIAAAKKYGARGVGIDLDPQRVEEARANAKAAGVEDRVRFMVGDLFASDFSEATVVTLFLWPGVNRQLRPHLWRQLKVGTRIVSYIWDMGQNWPPEKTERIGSRDIHYWTIKKEHKNAS